MDNCQPNCGCKFEVDSACVRYTDVDLGTTSINTGDTIETTIIKIDAAINNLQQTFESGQTSDIEGPINKVVKFGPPNTPLLPSQTYDDGLSIGINATVDPAFKMSLETSANQSGLKITSLNNGKDAIVAKNEAVGAVINKGIVSLVSGSSVSNIGIETSTTGASNINVGISATALGGTSNYSAQLKDGTETTQGGKFLKDTGSGKANWNYIYLSDIQDYQPYSLPIADSETLGGVIIGSGINVTTNGVISVTPYSLPISTSTVLGGVKIGSGINVANDGTISVPTPTAYSLPTASSTVLGGVKIGNGLAIDGQGILSANIGEGTLNYVAKFTPNGYSIDDSQIYDDGDLIRVGNMVTGAKITLNSNKLITLYSYSSVANSRAIYANVDAAGGVALEANTGYVGAASAIKATANANSGTNIGIYTLASNTSSLNIGLKAEAKEASPGQNFAIQLIDGTQTTSGGKFLRDMGGGKANWAEINPQKTITASYTLTSADNGYSIIVENGTNAVTITIPSGLPTSMQVGFIQDGTGDVTFAGSTLNCAVVGATKIKGQYDQAYLEKKGTSEIYYLLGNTKV